MTDKVEILEVKTVEEGKDKRLEVKLKNVEDGVEFRQVFGGEGWLNKDEQGVEKFKKRIKKFEKKPKKEKNPTEVLHLEFKGQKVNL